MEKRGDFLKSVPVWQLGIYSSFTYKNISYYNNITDYPDYNNKRNNWKFYSTILKTKINYTWKTADACTLMRDCMSEKNAIVVPSINIFLDKNFVPCSWPLWKLSFRNNFFFAFCIQDGYCIHFIFMHFQPLFRREFSIGSFSQHHCQSLQWLAVADAAIEDSAVADADHCMTHYTF